MITLSAEPTADLCIVMFAVAEISCQAETALETFAKEPFIFALKPVVKRVLQSIASSKPIQPQVSPICPSNSCVFSVQCLSHIV